MLVVQQARRSCAMTVGAEVAADDVSAERQRQSAGLLVPPLAEIDDQLQSLVGR